MTVRAVLSALAVCAALYAATALAGVACYGAAVRNDVLASLGAAAGHDPFAAFAGAAMLAHLALAPRKTEADKTDSSRPVCSN